MKALLSKFDSSSVFPLEILYQDANNKIRELSFHYHEWYEIVFVYEGEGTFFIDQSILSMEKGSLFIIPKNTIHRAILDNKNPVASSAIFFNPNLIQSRLLVDSFNLLHLFESSARHSKYKYQMNDDQQKVLIDYLSYIHTEDKQKKQGYRHAILSQLQLMLIFLCRELSIDRATISHECPAPSWMNDILSYINEHYMEGLTLEDLSTYGNVSAAHLSRVFKKMTGLTISDYVSTKKVLQAKKLLLDTNLKVTDIAKQCGFESMPYFHRTFKKYSGITPSAYRKQNNELR